MKLASRPSAIRQAASFMLALWALVLASGVANACLLEDPLEAFHFATGQFAPASNASGAPGHPDAADPHDEDGLTDTCVKACDEGAQALQSNTGAGSPDAGPPPFAALLRHQLQMTSAPVGVARFAPPLGDPPERIRYSRWAL